MSRLSLLVIVCLIASLHSRRLVDQSLTDDDNDVDPDLIPEDQNDYDLGMEFSKRADVIDRKLSVIARKTTDSCKTTSYTD